ncbi:hypothetical protein GBAR_LOCUS11207, partial [Geodia barretti]
NKQGSETCCVGYLSPLLYYIGSSLLLCSYSHAFGLRWLSGCLFITQCATSICTYL